MSDLMEEHIESGSRCALGHPLMLVAEGYAYCCQPATAWWSWRLCEATAKRLDDFVPGPREQQQMFAGVQL